MVKRIILLALCFIFYIIINIIIVTATGSDEANELIAQHKYKFELLVKCYGQMFNNGLIIENPNLQKSDNDTFKTILTKFYTTNNINIEEEYNGDIVPCVNNKQFESDDSFDNFRNKFIDLFIQSGYRSGYDISFRNKIIGLSNKINCGKLHDDPLKTFVLEYKADSDKEYFKKPTTYCYKYSEDPKAIENELIAQRKYDLADHPIVIFQTVLTNFYTTNNINIEEVNNGDIVPCVNNKQFERDDSFNNFRNEFIDLFMPNGDDFILQIKIRELSNKINYGKLHDDPMRMFVLEYKADSDKGPKAFCIKYSKNLTKFENELIVHRKYEFELLVKCYGQMFKNGLIKENPNLEDHPIVIFQIVLTNFYTTNYIITEKDNNGDIVPCVSNFISHESFVNLRYEFTKCFVQSENEDEFRNKITILNTKPSGCNIEYYLLGPKSFCNEYSKRPKTFQNELIAQRKYKFELLVKCYGQMFNNGLIKENPKLQKNDTDTFQKVLTNFYTTNYIITERDNNGDIVPRVNNIRFISQPLFDSFKIEFVDTFMRRGDDAEFQNQIKKLTDKSKEDELDSDKRDKVELEYPLTVFANKYAPSHEEAHFTTPKAFCLKYSTDPESFNDSPNNFLIDEQ